MNRGSIIKRGSAYYWKYKKADGKYTCQVIRDETGKSVGDRQRAMALVERSRSELHDVERLKTKAEYLTQVAEIKKVIHACKVTLPLLEEAYFNHPARTEVSPRYERNYRTAIRSIGAFLALHHPEISLVADVTEEIAGEYLASYWRSGISGKTYNGRLDTLRVVFRLFLKMDNPFLTFPKKAVQQEQREAFTIDELTRIWARLNDESYYMLYKDEMRLLYVLALNTGARCGDLCLLKNRSIDWGNNTINFIPSKTKNSSHIRLQIPMNAVVKEQLQHWSSEGEYLLPNVAERYRRTPDGIVEDTIKLLEHVGIQTKTEGETRRKRRVVKKSFHSFRHTFASLMIEGGVSQIAVSRLLGHSTLQMTNRYVHIADSQKTNAVSLLPVLEPKISQPSDCLESKLLALSMPQAAINWLIRHIPDSQKHQFSILLSYNHIE